MKLDGNSSPIEKLDFFLTFIKDKHGTIIPIDKLFGNSEIKMTVHQIEMIYERLVKDGFATCEIRNTLGPKKMNGDPNVIKTYSITFDGDVFLSKGGYTKQEEINALNLDIDKAELKRRNRNDTLIVRGTIGATVVGLCLLALEIIKFTKQYYPNFPYLSGH